MRRPSPNRRTARSRCPAYKPHGLSPKQARPQTKERAPAPTPMHKDSPPNTHFDCKRSNPFGRTCHSAFSDVHSPLQADRKDEGKFPESCPKATRRASRKVAPTMPASPQVAQKLPNRCPKAAAKMLRQPRLFWPRLPKFRPSLASIGQTKKWPSSAKISERCWPHPTKTRPMFTNLGRRWPCVWPNSAQISQRMAQSGQCWSKLCSSSANQTRPTLGQLRPEARLMEHLVGSC